MEWEVWFTDGTRRTSQDSTWADLPEGVLVVRAWFPNGSMAVNWSDGVYGHPSTWKQAGWVSDKEFARVLQEAQETTVPPSQREPG
jgi:hypothetical protein